MRVRNSKITASTTIFFSFIVGSILFLLCLLSASSFASAESKQLTLNDHENYTFSTPAATDDPGPTDDVTIVGELLPNQSLSFNNVAFNSLIMKLVFHPGSTLTIDGLRCPDNNVTITSMSSFDMLRANFCNGSPDFSHLLDVNSNDAPRGDSRFIRLNVQIMLKNITAQKLLFEPAICAQRVPPNNPNKQYFFPINLTVEDNTFDGARDVDGGATHATMQFNIGRTINTLGLVNDRNLVVLDTFSFRRNSARCTSTSCGFLPCMVVAFRNTRSYFVQNINDGGYKAEENSDDILVRASNFNHGNTNNNKFEDDGIVEVDIAGNDLREVLPFTLCPPSKLRGDVPARFGRDRYLVQTVLFPFRFHSSSQTQNTVRGSVRFNNNIVQGASMSEVVRLNVSLLVDVIYGFPGDNKQKTLVQIEITNNKITGLEAGAPDRMQLVVGLGVESTFALQQVYPASTPKNVLDISDIYFFENLQISNNIIYATHSCKDDNGNENCVSAQNTGPGSAYPNTPRMMVGQVGLWIFLGNLTRLQSLNIHSNNITVEKALDYNAIVILDRALLNNAEYKYTRLTTETPLKPENYSIDDLMVSLGDVNVGDGNKLYCRGRHGGDDSNNNDVVYDTLIMPSCVAVMFPFPTAEVAGDFRIGGESVIIRYDRSMTTLPDSFGVFVKIVRFSGQYINVSNIDLALETAWLSVGGISLNVAAPTTKQERLQLFDDTPSRLLVSNIDSIVSFGDTGLRCIEMYVERVDRVEVSNMSFKQAVSSGHADGFSGTVKPVMVHRLVEVESFVGRNLTMETLRTRKVADLVSFFDAEVDIDDILLEDISSHATIDMSSSDYMNSSDSSLIDLRFLGIASRFHRNLDRATKNPTRITIRNCHFRCERHICLLATLSTLGVGNVVVENSSMVSRSYSTGAGLSVYLIRPSVASIDKYNYMGTYPLNLTVRDSFFNITDATLASVASFAPMTLSDSGNSFKSARPGIAPSPDGVTGFHSSNVTALLQTAQFNPPFPVKNSEVMLDLAALFSNNPNLRFPPSNTFLSLSNAPVESITLDGCSCLPNCTALTSLIVDLSNAQDPKNRPNNISFLPQRRTQLCNQFLRTHIDTVTTAIRIAQTPDPLFYSRLSPPLQRMIMQPLPSSVKFEPCISPYSTHTRTLTPSNSKLKTRSRSYSNTTFNFTTTTTAAPTKKDEGRTAAEEVSDGLLTAGGVTSLSSPSPAAAGSFARMRAVIGVVNGIARGSCGESEEVEPQIAESPLRLRIAGAGENGKWSAGMIVGNMVVFFALFFVFIAAFYVYKIFSPTGNTQQQQQRFLQEKHHHKKKKKSKNSRYARRKLKQESDPDFGRSWSSYSLLEVISRSQACGVVVFGALMFLTPTTTAALFLLVRGGVNMIWKIIGAILMVVFLFCCFYYTYWGLFKREQKFDRYIIVTEDLIKIRESKDNAIVKLAKRFANFIFRIVGPEGEWECSKRASVDQKNEFGVAFSLLEGYLKRFPKFFLVELIVLLILSIAPILSTTIPGTSGCVAHAVVVLVALTGFLFMLLRYRPYVDFLSRVATPATTIVEMITIVIALSGAEVNILDALMVALSSVQLIISIAAFLFWFLSFLWPFVRKILRKFSSRRGMSGDSDDEDSSSNDDDEDSEEEHANINNNYSRNRNLRNLEESEHTPRVSSFSRNYRDGRDSGRHQQHQGSSRSTREDINNTSHRRNSSYGNRPSSTTNRDRSNNERGDRTRRDDYSHRHQSSRRHGNDDAEEMKSRPRLSADPTSSPRSSGSRHQSSNRRRNDNDDHEDILYRKSSSSSRSTRQPPHTSSSSSSLPSSARRLNDDDHRTRRSDQTERERTRSSNTRNDSSNRPSARSEEEEKRASSSSSSSRHRNSSTSHSPRNHTRAAEGSSSYSPRHSSSSGDRPRASSRSERSKSRPAISSSSSPSANTRQQQPRSSVDAKKQQRSSRGSRFENDELI